MKRIRSLLLLLTAFLTALPAAVSAKEWYIDGVNGNDANDGTSPERALLTLDAYQALHQDGDVLFICGTVILRDESALSNVTIKPCGEGVSPLILVSGDNASLEMIDVGVDNSEFADAGPAIAVEDNGVLKLGVDYCFSRDSGRAPLDMSGSGVNLDSGGRVFLISTGFEQCRMDVVPNLPTATPTELLTETATETLTAVPTATPTGTPTETSTQTPTEAPTQTPTEIPSETPSSMPETPAIPFSIDTPTPLSTATPMELIPFEPGEELPPTGLSAGVLSEKPADVVYRPLNQKLQIPVLNVSVEILSVPRMADGYPVAWLGNFAGQLEGIEGVTVIAAHNHLNETENGPFALLYALERGSRVFLSDSEGMTVYAVRENMKIAEDDTASLNAALKPGDLVLITCEDERIEGGYANRRILIAEAL